jgi:hypothetical protein
VILIIFSFSLSYIFLQIFFFPKRIYLFFYPTSSTRYSFFLFIKIYSFLFFTYVYCIFSLFIFFLVFFFLFLFFFFLLFFLIDFLLFVYIYYLRGHRKLFTKKKKPVNPHVWQYHNIMLGERLNTMK